MKMNIQESTDKNIDTEQLDNLWNSVGWNKRGKERWKEVLSKSRYIYSLWENKVLIGFGRITEDGIMCMFYDIAVHPKYQGRGLGKQIMIHLIEKIKDKKYVSVGLFTWDGNPNNVPFYEKLGFNNVSSGMEL